MQGKTNIFGGVEIKMMGIAKNLVILLLELKLLLILKSINWFRPMSNV